MSFLFGFHYQQFQALAAYIDRIGADQINFKKFQIKEHHGKYYTEKASIKININNFSISCTDAAYAPTEEEEAAIKAELAGVDFPKSILASAPDVEDLLKSGQVTGTHYVLHNSSREAVVMCQERRDE